MTNKETADRLRALIDATSNGVVLSEALQTIADELDPPRPEPGTVVWWQDIEGLSDPTLGQVNEYGRIEFFGTTRELDPHEVTWKTAHVLAPDEVAVKIPPTHGWGHRITDVEIRLYYWDVDTIDHADPVQLIPRAEAERMEANHDA